MNRSTARRANGERGLTLLELMIALVVSTIIIGFLFGIHTRLSVAYRSQTGISQVLQTLRAGRQYLQRDLRMAGFMVPGGVVSVSSALNANRQWPAILVFNDRDGDGPDGFRVLFAEPDVNSPVVAMTLASHTITVVDGSIFPVNKPVMVLAGSSSCAVMVVSKVGNSLGIDPGSSIWNESPSNPQCDAVATQIGLGVTSAAHLLNVHSYRVDPSRPEAAVLQRSPTGAVEPAATDWEDLGVGFTNLQVASRYFEAGDTVDRDGDGDPERDWYSSENQETPDLTATRAAGARITDVSLSIEVHSGQSSDGPSALASPAFVVPASRENNRLGDWGDACPTNPVMDPCGVDLANTPDASRPVRYRGEHVYRWSTTLVDLRNLGVGL